MVDEARVVEEQRALRRARLLNLPYEDTSKGDIKLYPDILQPDELATLKAIPIYSDSYNLKFGITNTTSQATMNNLKLRFADQSVTFAIISDMGFQELIDRYNPPKKIEYKDVTLSATDLNEQIKAVSQVLDTVRADDILAYLVKQAYRLKASDIHLENQRDHIRVRYRVDGVLHPIAQFTPEKYRQLLSSLAIAANVSTNSDEAQTGHINQSYQMADGNEVNVNLRVETVPALYGMDVVLRLFNLQPELMNLDRINLEPQDRAVFDDIISHPNGLVLLVGPTGSGKTTTLYSMINKLNHPERKIITLEDPVEYYISGITQIPVSSRREKDGFAEKFRAVLRLDPDVIMVGEIRDIDTAKTALQSALTGHLVLSTYHAKSAAAAITRLFDMVGENPLFASAIRLISAQRLVRRLDDETKQPYQPDQKVYSWLAKIIDSFPPNVQKPSLEGVKLYRPGSSGSSLFGYRGQIAIRESLLITPELRQELSKPPYEITSSNIEKIAVKNGMITILQAAVLKVLAGETSIEEIARVVE